MIVLISATEYEVSAFLSNLTNKITTKKNSVIFIEGNFLEIGIVVAISGVGIKKARNCTNTLIKKYNPKIIVSAGFAGALNPKLQLGDVVISEWAVSLKSQEKIYLDNSLPYIAFKYLSGGNTY